MKLAIIHALLGAVLAGSLHAEQTDSRVTLSLDEFQELFSSARLEEAERRILDQKKIQDAEHKRKLAELELRSQTVDAESREYEKIFPRGFQILRHTALGTFNSSSPEAGVERDVATFKLELIVRIVIVEPTRWIIVPLANATSVVAANWEISQRNARTEIFESTEYVTDSGLMLLLRENQQVLATNRSGIFKIKFDAFNRVSRVRNLNTMSLSSMLYPLSEISFRVATSSSSLVRDFSIHPPSSVLKVLTSPDYADVQATLPLITEGIQVRWLDAQNSATVEFTKEEGESQKDGVSSVTEDRHESESPQVTAMHEVLHTVGEGTIRSLHNIEYRSTSEISRLNSVQFLLHGKDIRVTSVTGHALQSWTMEENKEMYPSKLVKATFKTSQLDSSFVLQVHTERDRHDQKEMKVELSRLQCIGVLRQQGQVAVIKDDNVEVHEHNVTGLSRCEASDLSSKLRLNVDRPIILSYRYLNPDNLVVLDVIQHAAMETLEATIDRVHYKALVMEKHTVHSFILILQSTKLQYLDTRGLPSTATKYTATVNSVPVKPVKGQSDHSILIPLLIGLNPETANDGGSIRTSVEVTYFSSHDALGSNGTMTLDPPHFDLPISVLTAHYQLPTTYEYSFLGDFGSEPLTKITNPIPAAFSYTTGKRVVSDDYEFSAVDDAWPEDIDGWRNSGDGVRKIGAVKIVTPKTGRSFHFQRLLVVDDGPALNVSYALPRESWWEYFRRFQV